MFYVGLDPSGSPLVVLDSVGGVVRQLSYDPLGACLTDTAAAAGPGGDSTATGDASSAAAAAAAAALLVHGYAGGVLDPATRLVMLDAGRRVYDPALGRCVEPDYRRLIGDVSRLVVEPRLSDLYDCDRLSTTSTTTTTTPAHAVDDSPPTGRVASLRCCAALWRR